MSTTPWQALLIFAVAAVAMLCSVTLLRLAHARRPFAESPPPGVGTVTLVVTFLLGFSLSFVLAPFSGLPLPITLVELAGLTLGLTALTSLGIYDEVRGVTRMERLAVVTIVALAAWGFGFRIGEELPAWLSIALTIPWVIGISYVVGWSGQLDAATTPVVFAIGCLMLAFGIAGSAPLMMCAGAALAGPMGVLWGHEWRPGQIRLGLNGAMSAGFVVALVGVLSQRELAVAWSVFLPLLCLGPALGGVILARRRNNRIWLPAPSGDDHRGRWSKRGFVVACGSAAAAFAATAVADAPSAAVVIAGTLAIAAVFRLTRTTAQVRALQLDLGAHEARVTARRVKLRDATRKIRSAISTEDMWREVIGALQKLDVVCGDLTLNTRKPMAWRYQSTGKANNPRATVVGLHGRRYDYGSLAVTLRPSAGPADEAELLIHLLAEAIVEALERCLSPELKRSLMVARLPIP